MGRGGVGWDWDWERMNLSNLRSYPFTLLNCSANRNLMVKKCLCECFIHIVSESCNTSNFFGIIK